MTGWVFMRRFRLFLNQCTTFPTADVAAHWYCTRMLMSGPRFVSLVFYNDLHGVLWSGNLNRPKKYFAIKDFYLPIYTVIYIFSTYGAVRGDIRVLFSGFFKTCSLTNRELYLPVVSGLKVRVKCERALPGTAQNPDERCSGLRRLNLAFPVKSRH